MAAKDLDIVDIKPLDMTTCCICTEVYTDPIVLPCVHTFCMKCLEETGLKINKEPGDEMLCPICRRMFKIPPEGFHGLPKNFFIESLIQVANLSDQSESPIPLCDACAEENEEAGKEVPAADTYCVDCNQKFCPECCRQHRKFKLTKNHYLLPVSQYEIGQNVMTDQAPGVCKLHEHHILNIYCADCKRVVCAMCFIDNHKNHDGSHVNKFMDDFRKQIESNVEAINECRSKAEMKKRELLKVKEDIQEKVENLESDVEKRRDELKQFTDHDTTSLLEGLYSRRQSKLKEIQMATDDIDTYLLSSETYNACCQEIMAKGSASDICRAFSDLSVRALELQEQNQLMIERKIQSFNFCFRKSELEEFLQENCDNLIGEIEEEGASRSKKGIKESLLSQQSNEIDQLRKELKSEMTNKEILRFENVQFRINLNKEVQANKTLTEELSWEHANSARVKKLGEMIHNLKINCNTCQAENKKLKQELDVKIMTNSSLQSNNDKLKEELDKEKITNKSLQAENKEVKQELDARIMTNSSHQNDNDQLEEELDREKITNESLQTKNYKLKQELDVKIMTNSSLQSNNDKLKEELDREKIASKSIHTENYKLKQELDVKIMTNSSLQSSNDILKEELEKEKIASKSCQAENDKLKQELEKEKMTNNSVQASTNLFVQEMYAAYKMTTRALEDDVKKLKQEPETKKTGELPYRLDPVLIQTITTKAAEEKRKTISGLTILDKELFVVSEGFSEVEVHDLMRLTFSHRWNLKELTDPIDIGSCNRNKCLYIFNDKGHGMLKEILKVGPSGNLIKNWSTGNEWGLGLSVTYESNVLLTVYNKNKLNEYSPDGQLIREINLLWEAGIRHLGHAIKLTNGHFMVSLGMYDDDLHRVCMVDGDGKLVKLIGGECGMTRPSYLSIDGDGFVMVADRGNSRVLLFDSDLQFQREIVPKEKHGLRRPWRILLDELNGRLLVADNEVHNKGILIFDFK